MQVEESYYKTGRRASHTSGRVLLLIKLGGWRASHTSGRVLLLIKLGGWRLSHTAKWAMVGWLEKRGGQHLL